MKEPAEGLNIKLERRCRLRTGKSRVRDSWMHRTFGYLLGSPTAVLAVALLFVGSPVCEADRELPIHVQNSTDKRLELAYARGNGAREEIGTIGAREGQEIGFPTVEFTRRRKGCAIAALVATTRGGREVASLGPPVCNGDVLEIEEDQID